MLINHTANQLTDSDQLDLTFAALSDPTRRQILILLKSGESSATRLAEPFTLSKPAITKHLKVLERAGLIIRSRSAQWRPSRLDAAPLKMAAEWIGGYRHLWEEKFDRLDGYLQELREKGKTE
jgi:DNA-binding transcriptional ArsR family regulator